MTGSPQATGGARLSYTEDSPGWRRVVEQFEDVDSLLDRLDEIQVSRSSDLFIGVNLKDASGNELGIGLADCKWAVLYSDPQHTTICYALGDASADGHIELCFEQWEVLPRKYFLPIETAKSVIRTWFTTGGLSTDVEWDCQSLVPEWPE